MDLNLRGFFTRDALIRYLKALPALKTPVIDTVFTNRPNHPLPFVGEDMLKSVVRAMPVVRRGAPSIPVTKDTSVTAMYEPLPIRPNVTVTGVELNNLKLLGQSSKETWAQNKTDHLRRIVRATTEAIAAGSLSGRIVWPVQLDGGGWESWEINYGTPAEITPAKLWDASNAGIKDVFETLDAMKEAIEDNGYGDIVFWAGKKAYSTLLILAEAFKSTANMNVRVTDQGIDIA
ncbi:major capsid protein, partial [Desulforegula conservatrix]|uniref:major capsid protein n=1 Tax=Desulforegula conservatrix TaxID=153026 RepID=UPI000555C514